MVSSDLQTRVTASKDKSEELLNKTLARDTDLSGNIIHVQDVGHMNLV